MKKYKKQCPVCGGEYEYNTDYVFIHWGKLIAGVLFNHSMDFEEGAFCFQPWMMGQPNLAQIQHCYELSELDKDVQSKCIKKRIKYESNDEKT